jgi:ferrochelatase
MKNYDFYEGRKDYVHGSSSSVGILLTNLGTPDEPTPSALRRYLKQFLSDARVIELPRLKWSLILNLFVLPFRPKRVSHDYQSIWTEEGSPLLVITRSQAKNLEERLSQVIGSPLAVEVGMRYGNPSIESALQKLRDQGADRILVVPMYGQYSSATSGSTFDCLADELKRWRWIPSLRTIMQFHDHPLYIDSLAKSIRDFWEKNGKSEKLLMSFHGIPQRYHTNGDPYPCHCFKTARLVAEQLELKEEEYIVSFQSLFGKEEWVKPYTDETLKSLAKGGVSSVDVICPGFLADCLETIEEIEVENKENFIEAGGKEYRYIPALNDREDFMDALSHIVLEHLGGWYQSVGEWSEEKTANECRASLDSYNKVKANS